MTATANVEFQPSINREKWSVEWIDSELWRRIQMLYKGFENRVRAEMEKSWVKTCASGKLIT